MHLMFSLLRRALRVNVVCFSRCVRAGSPSPYSSKIGVLMGSISNLGRR